MIIKQYWDYKTELWVITFLTGDHVEQAVDKSLIKARALAARVVEDSYADNDHKRIH